MLAKQQSGSSMKAVPQTMAELDKGLEVLAEHLSALETYLESVLVEDAEIEANKMPKPGLARRNVPLANELSLRCEKVEWLNQRAVSLIERVGV